MVVLLLNLSLVSAVESMPKTIEKGNRLADLGIKSIQIQEDEQEVTIKIKVKNYGRSSVEGFWYYINYGDSTGEYLYFEGRVRPRQTRIIRLTHTYENAGTHNAMVNLDPLYMIPESNEENNIEEFVVEIEESLADLAVVRIRVREQGNEARIQIRVKNYGTEDVEGFWYFINYGDSTGEFLYLEETIKAGRTKNLVLTHEYANANSHNGMVSLDPLFMIPESNENNNIEEFVVGMENNENTTPKIKALSQK